MPNTIQPLGFTPFRNKVSAMEALNDYNMSAGLAEIIGIGDLVRLNAGFIQKCSPTQVPIGVFQGWYVRSRQASGAGMSLTGDGSLTMFRKAWNGAISIPANMEIMATIDDSPDTTFRVQCGYTANNPAARGTLVDLSDSPGGPDLIFGKSQQKVTTPTSYFNITAITVSNGGSGFVQGGVDFLVDGVIQTLRPNDITVAAGAVTAITPLNPIQGLPTNTPVLTIQAKPGFPGTGPGAFVGTTFSGAQTPVQFRIERILEQPIRVADSSFNTVGYDLSSPGLLAWVEVAFARHARGGTALLA